MLPRGSDTRATVVQVPLGFDRKSSVFLKIPLRGLPRRALVFDFRLVAFFLEGCPLVSSSPTMIACASEGGGPTRFLGEIPPACAPPASRKPNPSRFFCPSAGGVFLSSSSAFSFSSGSRTYLHLMQ